MSVIELNPLSFGEAQERLDAADSTLIGRATTASKDRWLRGALNAGRIVGFKVHGRWQINAASVDNYAAQMASKQTVRRDARSWDTRARLLVGTLLREAMNAKDRDVSWPFGAVEDMPDDERDALWAAMHRQLQRLDAQWPPEKEDAGWVKLAMKQPPTLRLV